jgi:predicted phosphoribosyltransferase/nucleotide-binding universal stress UspA family protein
MHPTADHTPPSFRDRYEAGRVLAASLERYAGRDDIVVLGLPRGGVPVAYEIARSLGVPLDVFTVRKLGVPGHEEFAMGAIGTNGMRVLNYDVIEGLRIPHDAVVAVAERERRELERRELAYRDSRPFPALEGKTVILVDDGIATGASMLAAVAALRERHPLRIVVAVPVGAHDSCALLRQYADEIVCLRVPEYLGGVGAWYADFTQVEDAEVRSLLAQRVHEIVIPLRHDLRMEVFTRVLVAVDGSPPSDAAVRLALQIAAAGPRPSLRFVTVFEPSAVAFGIMPQELEAACRATLDAACTAAREAGLEATSVMREGAAVDAILSEADDWNAGCTVIGTHGRGGIARALFGSCAEGVLRRSARPVLVAHGEGTGPAGSLARMLCAYDGSAAARRAFDAVAALAVERDAELHVLSVVQLEDLYATGYERDGFDPDGSIHELYDEARHALKTLAASVAPSGVRVAPHVVGGADAAALIADYAARHGCGLIAMGTHGRRGIGRAVLGSTAEAVIRRAAAPVLVFHEPPRAQREGGAAATLERRSS